MGTTWIKIALDNPLYPKLLKEIYNPPKYIWANGNIDLLKEPFPIAMVGTRKCDSYGLMLAKKFGTELANFGATIVSGLALGIDSACHQAALDCNGKTIAVLACGPDKFYPSNNVALRKDIEENGLVITPYDFGSGVTRSFEERNRIIAGLCIATIVVEAPKHSGALITAAQALEENRDVYAFCGDLLNENMAGCHDLINQGATLITDARTFMNSYSDIYIPSNPSKPMPNLSDPQKKVYNAMNGIIGFEELYNKTNMPINQLLSVLTQLEIYGLVTQLPGKRYCHTER